MHHTTTASLPLHALAALGLLASSLGAAPVSYDFKDPKGVNSAAFNLDAPLESISGTATGVSGMIAFDAEAPASVSGRIVIAADSLTVPNPMMLEHLRSPGWLDVAAHPEIVFEAKSATGAKVGAGGTLTLDVTGTLTLHGITRELTVPVSFTSLPGKLKDRTNGQVAGDLLVVRSKFTISRKDFGLKPGEYEDKVSDTIAIQLSLAGAHATP